MSQAPPGVPPHCQGSEEKDLLRGCSWVRVGPASSGYRSQEHMLWQHRLHPHSGWGLRTEVGGGEQATGAAGSIPFRRWGEAIWQNYSRCVVVTLLCEETEEEEGKGMPSPPAETR